MSKENTDIGKLVQGLYLLDCTLLRCDQLFICQSAQCQSTSTATCSAVTQASATVHLWHSGLAHRSRSSMQLLPHSMIIDVHFKIVRPVI